MLRLVRKCSMRAEGRAVQAAQIHAGNVSLASSLNSPVIQVGRARRGQAAGDLRAAGMRFGQCSGEGDTAARDLCANIVGQLERRRDSDGGAALTSAATATAAATAAGDG